MKKKPEGKKKPYTPPQIDSKPVYEVNALGCAKCPSPAELSLTIACIRGVKKYS